MLRGTKASHNVLSTGLSLNLDDDNNNVILSTVLYSNISKNTIVLHISKLALDLYTLNIFMRPNH